MTELTGKLHGRSHTLKQIPAHYLLGALDDYLIAEYPDKVLGATIHLSIGVETLIKSKLENIEPLFIHHKLDWRKWKKLRRSFRGIELHDREHKLRLALSDVRKTSPNKTIDFARAIEVFHLLRPLSFLALRDLAK